MAYLFDPTQFRELGYNYHEGDGFSLRYQMSKKLFFKSIYIPLGPNCESKKGFENFLNYIDTLKFTKVKIDLPTIYNHKHSKEVVKTLKSAGFKPSKYIQDDETILVTPEDLKQISRSEMNQVRYGLKRANIVVKNKLTDKDIDQIYDIYSVAVKRLGVAQKDKSILKRLSEDALAVLAYDKETNQMQGFWFNYFTKTDLSDVTGKPSDKLLLLMYTGLTDKGRDLRLGRAMVYELLKSAFDDYGVDVADFHGASRSKGRSYVGFKQSFSKRFWALPGSFERTKLF